MSFELWVINILGSHAFHYVVAQLPAYECACLLAKWINVQPADQLVVLQVLGINAVCAINDAAISLYHSYELCSFPVKVAAGMQTNIAKTLQHHINIIMLLRPRMIPMPAYIVIWAGLTQIASYGKEGTVHTPHVYVYTCMVHVGEYVHVLLCTAKS